MININKAETARYQLVEIQQSKLDSSNSEDFKLKVIDAISGFSEPTILDMSQVDFIDSSGLGALICILKKRQDPELLILCGLSQSVERLFMLTKMDTVFKVKNNTMEAINSI